MNICIIGAGNGGCALAADLTNRSFQVTLYSDPHHLRNYNTIKERGGLEFSNKYHGFIPLTNLTTDIKEAISNHDIIFMVLPAQVSEDVFEQMTPYLHDGQIIISMPGAFTSFAFQSILDRDNNHSKIILCETDSLPYACRVVNSTIQLYEIKNEVSLGFLDSHYAFKYQKILSDLFPCKIKFVDNCLEIGLSNMNGVVHPLTSLLNVGWIENTKGNFYFYKEGMSISIASLLESIDNERIAIGQALGIKLPSLLGVVKNFYGAEYNSIHEFATQSPPHNAQQVSPVDLKSRYIIEDVPYALVPWYYLAKCVSLEAPMIELAIHLASAITGRNYLETGRKLKLSQLFKRPNEEMIL